MWPLPPAPPPGHPSLVKQAAGTSLAGFPSFRRPYAMRVISCLLLLLVASGTRARKLSSDLSGAVQTPVAVLTEPDAFRKVCKAGCLSKLPTLCTSVHVRGAGEGPGGGRPSTCCFASKSGRPSERLLPHSQGPACLARRPPAPLCLRDDAAAAGKGTIETNGAPPGPLVALDPAFWELVAPDAAVSVLAEANYSFALEAPVWLPKTRQVGRQQWRGVRGQLPQLACCPLPGRLEGLPMRCTAVPASPASRARQCRLGPSCTTGLPPSSASCPAGPACHGQLKLCCWPLPQGTVNTCCCLLRALPPAAVLRLQPPHRQLQRRARRGPLPPQHRHKRAAAAAAGAAGADGERWDALWAGQGGCHLPGAWARHGMEVVGQAGSGQGGLCGVEGCKAARQQTQPPAVIPEQAWPHGCVAGLE
jgi:hypothetical protein